MVINISCRLCWLAGATEFSISPKLLAYLSLLQILLYYQISWNTTTFTAHDILPWVNVNKLLLNPSKTEFLLIGAKQQQQYLEFSDLTILSLSNDIISVSSSARNLGFIFDYHMSFSDQINSISRFFTSETSVQFVIFSSFYSHNSC